MTTVDDIWSFIREHAHELKCFGTCNKKLSEVSYVVQMYPHEGGIEIEGAGKQWVYVHCNVCGYDTALWKLVRLIERRR